MVNPKIMYITVCADTAKSAAVIVETSFGATATTSSPPAAAQAGESHAPLLAQDATKTAH